MDMDGIFTIILIIWALISFAIFWITCEWWEAECQYRCSKRERKISALKAENEMLREYIKEHKI